MTNKPCDHCDNNARIGVSYHDYWREVREIATCAAVRELLDQDDIAEYLHETIDGHQYVIYTFKARAVMLHTDNDNAMWGEMGLDGAECMSDVYTRGAYWAMLADIHDATPDGDVMVTLHYDDPTGATKYLTLPYSEIVAQIDDLRETYNNLQCND